MIVGYTGKPTLNKLFGIVLFKLVVERPYFRRQGSLVIVEQLPEKKKYLDVQISSYEDTINFFEQNEIFGRKISSTYLNEDNLKFIKTFENLNQRMNLNDIEIQYIFKIMYLFLCNFPVGKEKYTEDFNSFKTSLILKDMSMFEIIDNIINQKLNENEKYRIKSFIWLAPTYFSLKRVDQEEYKNLIFSHHDSNLFTKMMYSNVLYSIEKSKDSIVRGFQSIKKNNPNFSKERHKNMLFSFLEDEVRSNMNYDFFSKTFENN